MKNISILWVDDEINFLKPHILFLQEKGYQVETANNGDDGIKLIDKNNYDLVFLDEQMPGLSGIEVLEIIKNRHPNLPVVMITKSEEENIMEEAIGSKIADYLIKPVNPNQILLSIKKSIDHRKLISEKSSSVYQQEFRKISMTLSDRPDNINWKELYRQLVYWELELTETGNEEMQNILQMQKDEANLLFGKYISSNYIKWIKSPDASTPTFSHTLVKRKVAELVNDNQPLFFVVIDNLRYDQWSLLKPILLQYFTIEDDDLYFSILPTSTQYARNALFSGLMPSEIERKYPKLWMNELDEGSKNQHEEEFFSDHLHRLGKPGKFSFNKILNLNAGKQLASSINNLIKNPVNTIVYNFVDMLSHARTEMEIIRELAEDDAAYRSLTMSWFQHSPLLDIFKQLSEKKVRVVITTDHGSIRVQNAVRVVGDKETSSNLRYKMGRSLDFNHKNLFVINNPKDAFLPMQNVSSRYIFASGYDYLVYPNNYNHFAQYYKNTLQHGGISLEEMLIPVITMTSK